MKTIVSAVVAIALLLFLTSTKATDVDRYQHPELDLSAVVTDEPCPQKILDLLQGHPDDMAALRHVRVDSLGEKFDACVLPKDESGDYAIFDEHGQSGWLTAKNLKPVF